MLASLLIVFREAVEAALVIGIVLAATQGMPGRGRLVLLGVLAGAAGAGVVALFAGGISELFEGSGQELLNAAVLLVAVVMLAWHVAWMARHGRQMAAELRDAGHEVAQGRRPPSALAVVVAAAVLREGAEVVLFLYGIAAGGGGGAGLFLGGLLGLAAGAGLGALAYFGLVRLPARALFRVTGWLVTLLAAGLAAQAVGFLQQAGTVTALSATAWDTSAWLPDGGLPGRALRALVGYTDRPSEAQVLAWVGTFAAILVLERLLASPPRAAAPIPHAP